MEILDWAEGNAEKLVQKYLDAEPNEVFSQKDLKNKGDYYIGTESSSDSETVFIDVCFGDEFEKHDNNIDKNYEYFTRFAEDISDNMNYDVSVMTNSDAQTILFQFTDWFPEESEEPEEDYADGGKVSKYKVPSIEEIRKYSDEELTDLRWAYNKVRNAAPYEKMFVNRWFNTLNKRIDIVRKERGLEMEERYADGGKVKNSINLLYDIVEGKGGFILFKKDSTPIKLSSYDTDTELTPTEMKASEGEIKVTFNYIGSSTFNYETNEFILEKMQMIFSNKFEEEFVKGENVVGYKKYGKIYTDDFSIEPFYRKNGLLTSNKILTEQIASEILEKLFKTKTTMAEGGELDDEDSLNYNSISDLQSERNRLVRWSNQYGSKGADYKIKQIEERIEYLKSKDSKMANGGELEDDTFVILFKAYGFVQQRGSYGTRTFYNRQHNATIYYDPKYRSISGYVGGGEGNDEVIPYSVDGVLDFFIEHDISESEPTPFGRGGMDVGHWYRDKTGEEYRFIGEDINGQLLFNDGKKIIYKPLEDFEDEPKEKKLFKFFRMGGALKEDFLEDVAEMHNEIKEITLKDGSKITHDELMEAHQFLEPDETQEYYASMQYGKGGTFDSKVESISKKLVGKPVPKQYRKEYGSRYDKQDAEEAARRIVGNMRKLYGE
jgi:hypothetical protein